MSTTGNEIAIRDNGAVMPSRSFQQASDLDSWIGVVDNIAAFAEQVCRTSFVPKAYRNDAAAVTAAILVGRELGLPPMTALRHVQVVEGSPGLSAEYKRARVLAAGHRLDITEHTTEACTVTGHRKGHEPVTVRYTMKDARTAGLVKDRGAWMTRPRRMLFARASTEVVDALFSDLTNGLPTAELLEDDADAGEMPGYAEEAPAAAPQRVTGDQLRERSAARKAQAATAVVMSSREQFDEIKAHFDRLGIPAEQRGALISELAGRDVPAPAELTAAEAASVISALEDRPATDVVDAEVVDDGQPAQLAYDGKDPRGDVLVRLGHLGITGGAMEHVGAILGIPAPPSMEQLTNNDAIRVAVALARCGTAADLEVLEREGIHAGE